MKEIIVKCQEDFDSIRDVAVSTTIKVVSGHIVVKEIPANCHLWLCGSSRAELRGSSSAELYGSSRAVLWNSSSAVLWGLSKAICYMTSVARVNSGNVSIEAFDDVTVYEHERPRSITKSELVNLVCPLSDPKFDEWIERGWIVADGIRVKYLSHRQVGGAVLYKGETFDKRDIFVARAGEKFAHGDTPEQAVSDLRFKIADRDTSRFKNLAIDKRYPVEDLIEAYRVITGACETGVKMFCEKIKLNEEYTIKEVLKLTKDQYGHSEFGNFFGVKQ